MRFEYWHEKRDDVREMSAVHTPEELQTVIERNEANARGEPTAEPMLADAHWMGCRERPSRPSRLT